MAPTSLIPAFASAFILLAGLQEAHGLTLVADGRYGYSHSWQLGFPSVTVRETPDVPFGPFHALESAFQDSEMQVAASPDSGDVLSGSAVGGASGFVYAYDGRNSESVFSIRFRIDGPSAEIQLSGVLDGSGSAYVELRDASTSLYYESVHWIDFYEPVLTPFAFEGTVGPGEYQLLAIARGDHNFPLHFSAGHYQMDFTVAESVPEPSTALAVALGLASLGGSARRRGRSA